ncbi:MAG: succinyl-diaminopimelate desuccinylase, partial [Gammaproteobacteria bacterium]|nr:succinyl-diaminopimelate desuccinylase [Gammaproteobacteria bacterium]
MNTATKVLDLTCELIRRPSITPEDGGCQELLTARLEMAGFSIERLDKNGVSNFWAQHGVATEPMVIFAGHTDVVPTGPEGEWTSAPFEPTIREGFLYGRGSADMKGSLAAMVIAAEQFVGANPAHPGNVALLVTSDEEGDAVHGTREVVEYLRRQNLHPDYCIVGEPSSTTQLGDTVRNGRRGSLNGRLSILGTQGHVAYPTLADNPIHRFAPALNALVQEIFDEGCAHYPPTS